MPRSKHRRKTDGKAVAHPGRGRDSKLPSLLGEGAPERPPGGKKPRLPRALPLFDWADADANRIRVP